MLAASIDLLRRLSTQPHLCCLWSPDACHLQWGVAPEPLCGLADLPALCGRLSAAGSHGWPRRMTGGALVQLDYEFPVGPWAERLSDDGATRGWCWPLQRGCRLDADGGLELLAADTDERERLQGDCAAEAVALPTVGLREALAPAWDERGHQQRVAAIREHIAAGDCYQVNLTLPFHGQLAPAEHLDLAVFARLIERSPAGYACLLRTPTGSVISHSPECFLAAAGRHCRSAPIKGTRARRPGHEAAARAELLGSLKDNAELAMIVDLVRNDLGRVSRPGGVRVERPPHVVDLDYVHHLLAVVTAELRPGCRLPDLLRAAFPAGSITGAPKIAAMRLIRELEAAPRGPYCGSFGWAAEGPGGPCCSLSVAIRSMILRPDGAITVHAGGGIVADSRGEAEWREVLAKLSGMGAALGSA